jgi:hypothetical protein
MNAERDHNLILFVALCLSSLPNDLHVSSPSTTLSSTNLCIYLTGHFSCTLISGSRTPQKSRDMFKRPIFDRLIF